MDKGRGVRRPHGNRPGSSERTSDLLKDARAPASPPRRDRAANGHRRPGNGAGRDPDPTEEIFGDAHRGKPVATGPPGAAPPTLERPRPPLPEKTHPVGAPESDSAPAGHRPGQTLPVLFDAAELANAGAPVPVDQRLPREAILAGRYVILDEVEDSGMGLVYKALDRQRELAGSSEPWVALKIARSGGGGSANTAVNLRQEFLKLSALRHPNIVAVYDLGSDDGTDFMVLEWLQGETLASVLARITSKRIALRSARETIRSVAEALAHAHAAGVVHGDVKPSNIFVTDDHVVKLLDFGATARSSGAVDDGSERSWATRAYASCEVLSGNAPLPADDVFALGVTAYLLLCGERPFGELDAMAARQQHATPPPLPEDARESWPAIRAALEFNAADRPADAAEFLRLFLEPADESRQPLFPRPIPGQVTAIAWGALAVLALGVTVWWSVPDGTPAAPIQRLLEEAEAAESAGQMVAPRDESAFARYSEVLERDPENAAAGQGLDRIAEYFLEAARDSLTAGNFEVAVADLEQARRVRPGHFGIAAIEDLIARYRHDLLVRAEESADSDPELADSYVMRAAALSDAADPDVARVREALQHERIAADIDALVQGIDDRILSERLTIPPGDSAVDLLRRAAGLDPDNRQVQFARDRIASALLFQAMFSISNGKLDDAEGYIDAAKSLRIRHLALARAEYELAKARHEALIAPGDSR